MHTFFEEYLRVFQKCHDDLLKTIEGLPQDAQDWSPAADANSITVLVFHVSGSERFWIGDVAMGESSNRDREAEFRARGVDMQTLKKRLDDSLAYARGALERLTLDDLSQNRVTPDGRTFTVSYALLHTLEHAREHVGHIELTAQLWRQVNTAK